jgi:hypothetical protein
MTCLCEKVHFFIGILTECRGTAERHQEATFLKVSGSAARPEIITKAEKDPRGPIQLDDPASGGVRNGLVKIVAQAVWRDDEKHLELPPVSLIHAPVPDLSSFGLELLLNPANVRDQHGRSILGRISSGDGKTDSSAIALQNHGRDRLLQLLDFGHAEMFAIPPGGGIEIRNR